MNPLPGPARPRSPLLRLLIALAFTMPMFGLQAAAWMLRGSLGPLPTAALSAALAGLGSWAAYTFYVRRFESRPVTELRGPHASRELGVGLVLGLAVFTATIGTLMAVGAYRVTGFGTISALAMPLLLSIGAGVLEEIVFRGVVFRLVEEWGGSWAGLIVSSALFGLGHAMNPNATAIGVTAIVLEAGVLLAAAFMLTRRLWLPIGIHIGWNVAEGGIFGVRVSGVPANGLLNGELNGPTWLAGGEFGPEASLVAVLLGVALGGVLLAMAVRRGRLVPRPRRRLS